MTRARGAAILGSLELPARPAPEFIPRNPHPGGPVLGSFSSARMSPATLAIAITGSVLLGGSDQLPDAMGQDAPAGGIAALVNGEAITYHELDTEIERRLLALGSKYPEEMLRGQAEQIRGEIIRELVKERLLLQRCKREKIEAREEEVEHWVQMQIENARTRDDSIRTLGDFFDRWEADRGENEELARRHIANLIRIQKLLDSIYRQEYVSPAELRAYYRRHPEEFSTESKYVFRQILLRGGDPDRKELLEAIQKDIEAGRDFEAMIEEYSHGPRKTDGGRYELTEKQLESWWPPVPETIRALPVGSVSEPLRTPPDIIHIVQLLEHVAGRQLEFEECQLQIRVMIRKQREQIQREQFEAEMMRNSDIRIFVG